MMSVGVKIILLFCFFFYVVVGEENGPFGSCLTAKQCKIDADPVACTEWVDVAVCLGPRGVLVAPCRPGYQMDPAGRCRKIV
uniref:Putative secreted protein n=1 Tax=Lutzomyia longipalpis TaxID=7200 RepID=A0A7G3AGI2_LUTLO